MRPVVNLASEPFRNRRLLWLVIVLIFILSSVVGFKTLNSISGRDKQIDELAPKVKALEAQVRAKEKSAQPVSALTLEQNRSLQAANELIARKAFSWSQLLNDLERHIPPTVRVVRIGVDKIGTRTREGATGGNAGNKTVFLMLDVIGKGPNEVTRMMSDLNKSGLFAVFPKSSKLVEGTEEVEFVLDVEYYPPTAPHTPRTPLANQIAEGKR